MNHPLLVGISNGFGDRADDEGGLGRGQRTILELLGQAAALDVAHGKEVLAVPRSSW
jgi:hypothetical protein